MYFLKILAFAFVRVESLEEKLILSTESPRPHTGPRRIKWDEDYVAEKSTWSHKRGRRAQATD